MSDHVHRLVFEVEVEAPDGERLNATRQRFRTALMLEARRGRYDIRCTDADCLAGFTGEPLQSGFETPDCSR